MERAHDPQRYIRRPFPVKSHGQQDQGAPQRQPRQCHYPSCGNQARKQGCSEGDRIRPSASTHQVGVEPGDRKEQGYPDKQLPHLPDGHVLEMSPSSRSPAEPSQSIKIHGCTIIAAPLRIRTIGMPVRWLQLRRRRQPSMPCGIHCPHSENHIVFGYRYRQRHRCLSLRCRNDLRVLPV